MRKLLYPLLAVLLLGSCGPDYILDRRYEMEGAQWTYDNVLSFEAEIPDTLGVYNLWMEIDHGKDFAYQNLYTRITTIFPDQKRLEQRLSFELADKFGNWQGDCRGDHCRVRIPIQESAFFNQAGTYTFMLEQYMRTDSIPAVRTIRFQIEDTGIRR